MNQETYGTMYYVDNVEESVSFYRKSLGIVPSVESKDWAEFPIGGHNLCLHIKELGQNYRENGVLIIKAVNVKSLYEKMQADGFNVRDLKEVYPGHWSFYLEDKSRNELSFYGSP